MRDERTAAPGWATYRLRIRSLPLSYAEHAPQSARQLHNIIANVLDVHTFNVETHRGWTAPSTPITWAFLNVRNFADGRQLINTMGQIVLGAGPWKRNRNTTVGPICSGRPTSCRAPNSRASDVSTTRFSAYGV